MTLQIAPIVGLGLIPTLLAPTPTMQSISSVEPVPVTQQVDALDPYERVIEYYQPRKAPMSELRNAARNVMHAGAWRHKARIDEETTLMMPPSTEVYGDSLMVIDTRGKIDKTLMLLRSLDENFSESAPEDGAESEPTQLFQYTVTHVSVDSVRKAFTSLYAEVQSGGDFIFSGPQLSYVNERNLVLMRGTADQIAETKTILERLDVPKPRVLLSFYLIEGASAEENDTRVPIELAKDLSALVPYEGFKLLTSAILPGDATSRIQLDAQLEMGRGEMELELVPAAYDHASETLALDGVSVGLTLTAQGKRARNSFRTSTSLKAGAYTVLGAIGADPIFVVIKMTTLR